MTIQDFLQQFSLLGIPCIILIPFIIEGLKRLPQYPTGWTAWIILGVSLIVFALAALTNYFPETAGFVSYFVAAILVWIGSIAAYNIVKSSAEIVKNASVGDGR